MNLPTYNIGTFLAIAMRIHPVTWGMTARASADLRPNHSEDRPAASAPNGLETTPREAIHEASDCVANLLSSNFGMSIALNPCDSPTDIWPE